MSFYVTGYKFGMMVLVSLSFSRCVNFVGRGQILVLVLKAVVLVLVLVYMSLKPSGLGLGLERYGLDNNTAVNSARPIKPPNSFY